MNRQPLDTSLAPDFVTHSDWDRADMLGRVSALRGRRLILVNEEGPHRDFRAWGELRQSAGALVLDVVPETDWWRYVHLRMRCDPLRWPAAAVWVEL